MVHGRRVEATPVAHAGRRRDGIVGEDGDLPLPLPGSPPKSSSPPPPHTSPPPKSKSPRRSPSYRSPLRSPHHEARRTLSPSQRASAPLFAAGATRSQVRRTIALGASGKGVWDSSVGPNNLYRWTAPPPLEQGRSRPARKGGTSPHRNVYGALTMGEEVGPFESFPAGSGSDSGRDDGYEDDYEYKDDGDYDDDNNDEDGDEYDDESEEGVYLDHHPHHRRKPRPRPTDHHHRKPQRASPPAPSTRTATQTFAPYPPSPSGDLTHPIVGATAPFGETKSFSEMAQTDLKSTGNGSANGVVGTSNVTSWLVGQLEGFDAIQTQSQTPIGEAEVATSQAARRGHATHDPPHTTASVAAAYLQGLPTRVGLEYLAAVSLQKAWRSTRARGERRNLEQAHKLGLEAAAVEAASRSSAADVTRSEWRERMAQRLQQWYHRMRDGSFNRRRGRKRLGVFAWRRARVPEVKSTVEYPSFDTQLLESKGPLPRPRAPSSPPETQTHENDDGTTRSRTIDVSPRAADRAHRLRQRLAAARLTGEHGTDQILSGEDTKQIDVKTDRSHESGESKHDDGEQKALRCHADSATKRLHVLAPPDWVFPERPSSCIEVKHEVKQRQSKKIAASTAKLAQTQAELPHLRPPIIASLPKAAATTVLKRHKAARAHADREVIDEHLQVATRLVRTFEAALLDAGVRGEPGDLVISNVHVEEARLAVELYGAWSTRVTALDLPTLEVIDASALTLQRVVTTGSGGDSGSGNGSRDGDGDGDGGGDSQSDASDGATRIRDLLILVADLAAIASAATKLIPYRHAILEEEALPSGDETSISSPHSAPGTANDIGPSDAAVVVLSAIDDERQLIIDEMTDRVTRQVLCAALASTQWTSTPPKVGWWFRWHHGGNHEDRVAFVEAPLKQALDRVDSLPPIVSRVGKILHSACTLSLQLKRVLAEQDLDKLEAVLEAAKEVHSHKVDGIEPFRNEYALACNERDNATLLRSVSGALLAGKWSRSKDARETVSWQAVDDALLNVDTEFGGVSDDAKAMVASARLIRSLRQVSCLMCWKRVLLVSCCCARNGRC